MRLPPHAGPGGGSWRNLSVTAGMVAIPLHFGPIDPHNWAVRLHPVALGSRGGHTGCAWAVDFTVGSDAHCVIRRRAPTVHANRQGPDRIQSWLRARL